MKRCGFFIQKVVCYYSVVYVNASILIRFLFSLAIQSFYKLFMVMSHALGESSVIRITSTCVCYSCKMLQLIYKHKHILLMDSCAHGKPRNGNYVKAVFCQYFKATGGPKMDPGGSPLFYGI